MSVKTNKRKLGEEIEAQCVFYLQSKGVKILNKNYSCRFGEVDIIGLVKTPDLINPDMLTDTLVFYEVKFRKTGKNDVAEAAVNIRKQQNICRVSDYYRMMKHISEDTQIRFDVIGVNDRNITLYENAFEYIPAM